LPNFLFSIVAERRRQNKLDHDLIESLTYLGTLLMLVLAVPAAMAIEPLVLYIFGNHWLKAVDSTAVLMLGNVIFFPSIVLGALLTAHGHSGKWLRLTSCGSLLLWLFAGVGTLTHGVVGYAWGANISSGILLLWQCRVLKKAEGIKIDPNTTLRFLLLGGGLIWVSRTISDHLSHRLQAAALVGPMIGTLILGAFLLLIERRRATAAWSVASVLFMEEIQTRLPVLGKLFAFPLK
jgi:O-antigen/teichoic acid export membrane protein